MLRRAPAHSKARLSRNEVVTAQGVQCAEFEPDGHVHCIGMGVANGEKDPPAPEIATAFELLECEIQRIATALERISLRCSIREVATSARLEIRQAKQGHAQPGA
jgi:hypothetical protein